MRISTLKSSRLNHEAVSFLLEFPALSIVCFCGLGSKESHRETKFGTWLHPELTFPGKMKSQLEGGESEEGAWDTGSLALLGYWEASSCSL